MAKKKKKHQAIHTPVDKKKGERIDSCCKLAFVSSTTTTTFVLSFFFTRYFSATTAYAHTQRKKMRLCLRVFHRPLCDQIAQKRRKEKEKKNEIVKKKERKHHRSGDSMRKFFSRIKHLNNEEKK